MDYGADAKINSARSDASDVSDEVVVNSLTELARVFGFTVVELRKNDFTLSFIYLDEDQFSMKELNGMKTDREKLSTDLCKKAAKMTAKVCWKRKSKSDTGEEPVDVQFHTAAAYHLVGGRGDKEECDDVFIVGYGLASIKFDQSKAHLLSFYARSARDAAMKVEHSIKYHRRAPAKDSKSVWPSDFIGGGAVGENGSQGQSSHHQHPRDIFSDDGKVDHWGDDWQDELLYTSRSGYTDMSELSTASGNYRWALFTPAEPSPNKLQVIPEAKQASFINIPHLTIPSTSRSVMTSRTTNTMNSNLLSVRDFHCRLSSRTLRVDFETGIDIESMINMEKITDGTNGQVFGAIYKNKRVVIKAVYSDKVDSKVVIDEFCFEAEILARLAHPNICKAVGSGYVPLPFIVMEELQPMTRFVNFKGASHAQLTFEQVLNLGKDLADALFYLHEQLFEDAMVIHRDLKPENIGMDASGRLKLFDFGLGRCVRKRTKDTQAYKVSRQPIHLNAHPPIQPPIYFSSTYRLLITYTSPTYHLIITYYLIEISIGLSASPLTSSPTLPDLIPPTSSPSSLFPNIFHPLTSPFLPFFLPFFLPLFPPKDDGRDRHFAVYGP
jgi:hypothetical protein